MQSKKNQATSLALFCKVVDNFGDIGICWRLARQLVLEHNIDVTLWVDDLISFHQICHEVATIEKQQIDNVTIRHWRNQNDINDKLSPDEVADIVIEFFACDIPPSYIAAMVERIPRAVWLNLEGLSAEKWVEGCHTLPSPHPTLPLTKYFFFPGFTPKTGGLLLESTLLKQRQLFQQNSVEMDAFLRQLGVTSAEIALTKVSLFCYPHAPVLELFDVWQNGSEKVTCLVPEGVAPEAIRQFLGQTADAGTSATRGALTVRVLPFIPQPDYDKLLWACDINFVRGEDSFVRAQWAGRPFIWHIYPQDNDLHQVKLNAFLQCFTAKTESLVEFSLHWNASSNMAYAMKSQSNFATLWQLLKADIPKITMMTTEWQHQLIANGDLASNILKFAKTVQQGIT